MQNINLSWSPKQNGNESTFTVLLGDEPIFCKTMIATIFKYVGETKRAITFVETSKEFSFEQFNEFIMDLEQGITTKFVFDDCDGRETFEYSEETELFTFHMCFYTSNMKFEFLVTENIRIQFAKVFRQFLFYYLDYVDQEDNWRNVFVYRTLNPEPDRVHYQTTQVLFLTYLHLYTELNPDTEPWSQWRLKPELPELPELEQVSEPFLPSNNDSSESEYEKIN